MDDVRSPALETLMTILTFALWGLAGGAFVEGLEFAKAIRHVNDWPWRSEEEPPLGRSCWQSRSVWAWGQALRLRPGAAVRLPGRSVPLRLGSPLH